MSDEQGAAGEQQRERCRGCVPWWTRRTRRTRCC